MAALDLAQVQALTCSEDNQAIDDALNSSGGLSRELDLSGLRARIDVDTSALRFEERQVSTTTAVVQVSGSLSGQPVDQNIGLVNEGDVWKVCTSSPEGQ